MTFQPGEPTDLPPAATAGTSPDGGQGLPTTDPSAVHPPEGGQGQADAVTGLYDLSTVPDEYRSHVERIAKDIDRNVKSKLTEYSDYRKRWEGFEKLGVHELDPEGLGGLLEFAQALTDPDGARDAILDLAEKVGVDLDVSSAGEPGETDPIQVLRSELDDLRSWKEQQEQQERMTTVQQEELTRLQAEYAEVETAHGKPFTDEEKEQLLEVAELFDRNPEPLKAAYAMVNRIAGGAEAGLVKATPTPPVPAVPGGRAATQVEPITDFETAQRIHTERRSAVHA